jgi:DNA-binding NarL/FixJ family response regulator
MNTGRAPGDRKIRVLVADNSRIHTHLVADALRRDPLLEVFPFEASSAGLVAAALEQNTDVLVISSNLDEQSSRGFEILQELRAKRRDTKAVLLLGSSQDEVVLRAFRAGARGLFSRNDPLELLSECVRTVYQGQVWANKQALGVAVEALAGSPDVQAVNAKGMKLLSKRELQVVRKLAEGMTNREIAEQLKLSQHTVKNYLFRIFDKLGVSSRVELLFMTLSQANAEMPALSEPATDNLGSDGYSQAESDLLQKSAEAGLPAAQLALAQRYLLRRRDPQDLVDAYMWFLVATERALMARGFITKMMTTEQIEEAKRKASIWLSKLKKASPPPADSAAPPAPPALSDDHVRLWPRDEPRSKSLAKLD